MKNFLNKIEALDVKMTILHFDRETVTAARQYYTMTHCPQSSFSTITWDQLQELLQLDNHLRGALCTAVKLHNNEQHKLLWELLIDCQQFYNQQ